MSRGMTESNTPDTMSAVLGSEGVAGRAPLEVVCDACACSSAYLIAGLLVLPNLVTRIV